MPYINKTLRSVLDDKLNQFGQLLHDTVTEDTRAGIMNYSITRLLMETYGINHLDGLSYAKINEMVGVLQCVQHELYRREAKPYEDLKMFENGDVY